MLGRTIQFCYFDSINYHYLLFQLSLLSPELFVLNFALLSNIWLGQAATSLFLPRPLSLVPSKCWPETAFQPSHFICSHRFRPGRATSQASAVQSLETLLCHSHNPLGVHYSKMVLPLCTKSHHPPSLSSPPSALKSSYCDRNR